MEFQQDGRIQDEMAFPRTRSSPTRRTSSARRRTSCTRPQTWSSPPEDVEFQQDGQREDEFFPFQDDQQEDARSQDADVFPPRTVYTFIEMKSSSPLRGLHLPPDV